MQHVSLENAAARCGYYCIFVYFGPGSLVVCLYWVWGMELRLSQISRSSGGESGLPMQGDRVQSLVRRELHIDPRQLNLHHNHEPTHLSSTSCNYWNLHTPRARALQQERPLSVQWAACETQCSQNIKRNWFSLEVGKSAHPPLAWPFPAASEKYIAR